MNQADTAWMLISTALVLLMTPALAFFYGGLVRSKNALNTMMMSFISLGFVGVLWALVGYSLALTPGNNWLGDLSLALPERRRARDHGRHRAAHDSARALHGVPGDVLHHHRGADLGRHRRAHAVLGLRRVHLAVVGRRLRADRALGVGRRLAGATWARWDFAGGTVVHVNAGAAALVAALVVGKRSDYRRRRSCRTTCRSSLLGAGLLWFGWFGFNAGSALAASPIAGLAFVTTMLAPAATLVVWTFLDMMRSGKPTAVGARHGHRRRPRRGHAGRRLHQPDERDSARRDRRGAELLRADASAPRRRWTTRSTSSPRTASAARWARC